MAVRRAACVPCSGRRDVASPTAASARRRPTATVEAAGTNEISNLSPSSSSSSRQSSFSTGPPLKSLPRASAATMWKSALGKVLAANRLNKSVDRDQPRNLSRSLSRFSRTSSRCPRSGTGESSRRSSRRSSSLLSALRSLSCRTSCSKEQRMAADVEQLKMLLEPGQPLGDLSDFAKAYGDDAFCNRLLRKYEAERNSKKIQDRFKQALLWRETNRELLERRRFELGSDERVIGADLQRRPMVYLCLKNQILHANQCMDQKVVTMLQAIDNMPSGVEKAVHIWDLHGQRFRMSDLNPTPLIHMIKSQEGYFAERLQEVVIIGMPRMATLIKDVVWPMVPEATKKKVKFMTLEESQAYFRESCSQEVSGRILAAMAQNRDEGVSLDERKRSWMRVDESGELVPLVQQA